jgi:two-component system, chemotaxis family, sensor kinase CheA
MSIDLSQFHEAFFEEALLCLDQAEDDLLLLEKGHASTENLDSAFRAIHSIKGSAGSLGFLQIGQLAHEFESVLDELRSSKNQADEIAYQPNDEQVSVLLAALDLLRSQVGNAQRKNGDVAQSRVNALIDKLKSFLSLAPVSSKLNGVAQDEGHDQDLIAGEKNLATQPVLNHFKIRFAPHPAMLACGNEPLRYIDSLADMGEVNVTAFWRSASDDHQECQLSWVITLETVHTQIEILDLFSWIDDVCTIKVELLANPHVTLVPRRRSSDVFDTSQVVQNTNNRNTRSIQVQSEKIDALLSQLGELAIAQSDIENRVIDQEIIDLFQRLTRQTSQLQDAILAMRLSPIKILFRRFERVVRDAEIELGKQVILSIEGDDHQLDSSIIERLIDPLTHLIRNALDHGIEAPDARVANGKEPYATLKLTAEQKASTFVIRIEDDGRGLSIDNIRAKAIEKGLATASDVKSASQWAQMIFKPGFSTAASISQWSGRGVGLDAVAAALSQLNGRMELNTTPGSGTSIAISLPLTMAITDALIVECADEQYAIPMSAVAECLSSHQTMLATLPNQQILFRRRDQLFPYAALADLMQLKSSDDAKEKFPAVVITNGKDEAVLRVSQIIGQRQIVVKNIDKNLGATKYCASATLLGDSQVVFVLDAAQIIRETGQMDAIAA